MFPLFYLQSLTKRLAVCIFCLLCLLLCSGCQKKDVTPTAVSDMEYTIVTEDTIPDALKNYIESRKQTPFSLTFSDQSYLYVVKGYGAQDTGGYDIVVDDFYRSEKELYLSTALIGPSHSETIDTRTSYPYIILKTEFIDLPVTFATTEGLTTTVSPSDLQQ